MRHWLFLIFLILPCLCFPQQGEIVIIEDSATVELPKYKTRQDVEKEAEDQAVWNALENAFNREIIQGNTLSTSNKQVGDKIETRTIFNSTSASYVKGEFLGFLNKDFKEVEGTTLIDGKTIIVRALKCKIKIKARKRSTSQPEFDACTLGCLHLDCKKSRFNNDDDLFVYFYSKCSGNLTIFLDDGRISQRLLPYSNMSDKYEESVPIDGDQQYFLFSKDKAYESFGKNYITDEFELWTEEEQGLNSLYIVFSRNTISKPGLGEGLGEEVLTNIEKKQGYTLQKGTKSKDFQEWLVGRMIRDPDMAVKVLDITIVKK